MSAGTVISGGVVSRTVTENAALALFPRVSDAVQFTVVVAMPNIEPEVGVQLTLTEPSTRSVAVAVKVTVAPAGPVASLMMSAGTVIVGGVLSVTITLKDVVWVFPRV